jgi:sugar phosphate isomerase/epimerase
MGAQALNRRFDKRIFSVFSGAMKKNLFFLTVLLSLSLVLQAQSTGKGPDAFGIVSYTMRQSFAANFEATLDTIKSFGINNIEFSNLFGQSPEKIKASLDSRGMYCTSYGVSYEDLVGKTREVGNTAKILGAEFVRVAWIPHEGAFNMENAEKAVRDFNDAGKILKEEFGLTFCYHNHGYEFAPIGNGNTLFDVIVGKTNPEHVSFEMDILWAHIADVYPAELMKKYPDRFRLLHVKDLKKGAPHGITGTTDPNNDVVLGTGEINIPAVMKTAKRTKVKYYYLEDESDAATSHVLPSMKYLRKFLK